MTVSITRTLVNETLSISDYYVKAPTKSEIRQWRNETESKLSVELLRRQRLVFPESELEHLTKPKNEQ